MFAFEFCFLNRPQHLCNHHSHEHEELLEQQVAARKKQKPSSLFRTITYLSGLLSLHCKFLIVSPVVKMGKKLWQFFDEQVAQASTKSSVSSELTIQMQQYLRVNNLERKQDPLKWWKRNCHLYPHISKLAKNIFLFLEHLFHQNEF